MRRVLCIAAAAFAAAGTARATPSPSPDPIRARLEAARDRAVRYFAEQVHAADPGWVDLFGYLHRRFGVRVTLASGAVLHEMRAGVARPEVHALYRRIDDPDASVEKAEIAALPTPIDRITASALHCDRIPLPADWLEILRKASRAGAYALTHAVLATEWTVENGCLERAAAAELHAEQVALLEKLVAERAVLATTHEAAADIWIEAMVMLDYGGEPARVRREWVEEMLTLQHDEGGWPRHPRSKRPDPHATALALWVLLAQLEPSAPRIRWIAPPR
jgi:hypothetical protein